MKNSIECVHFSFSVILYFKLHIHLLPFLDKNFFVFFFRQVTSYWEVKTYTILSGTMYFCFKDRLFSFYPHFETTKTTILHSSKTCIHGRELTSNTLIPCTCSCIASSVKTMSIAQFDFHFKGIIISQSCQLAYLEGSSLKNRSFHPCSEKQIWKSSQLWKQFPFYVECNSKYLSDCSTKSAVALRTMTDTWTPPYWQS